MISGREGQFYVQWQRLVSLVGKLPFLVNQISKMYMLKKSFWRDECYLLKCFLLTPQDSPVMLASFAIGVGLVFTTSGFIYSLRYV